MSNPQTKPQFAKSLMDLALEQSGAVEYTAPTNAILALRVECYRFRSGAKQFGKHEYDKLTFSTRSIQDGMMTLSIERS